MRVRIQPSRGPADEAPIVRLTGGRPGREVTLIAAATDANGHRWESEAVFCFDQDGVVDVTRDPPRSGSYGSVDPAGPIWSMRFADRRAVPSTFAPPADRLALTLTAHADGGAVANAVAERRWRGPGVTRSQLRGDGFTGVVCEPAGSEPCPALALVPGGGVEAMEPTAALLASRGYVAMVVGYGPADHPGSVCELPLEALAEGIRTLSAHPRVDPGRVGVLCASVGAEGTLAALSQVDGLTVGAVVAISPSSVVWQARRGERAAPTSSWTFGGVPLPWVSVGDGRPVAEAAAETLLGDLRGRAGVSGSRLGYRSASVRAASERAAIRAERIAAPLLLCSGGDDQIWPATEMADELIRRRAAAGREGDRHLRFPRAGHVIGPPVTPTTVTWMHGRYSGGTAQGCAQANAEAWRAILAFFHDHLGQISRAATPQRQAH